ncbi:hypothetical protein OFO07_03295 [Campylobacter sp. JMF_06 NA1]|uniref:hypothetical protein n=1 Tax=Campylobacter sp. JMF_06 NA1 TaxID=2983823 RepID=UPI0022E9EEC3|nr:hypothetical protein [Campylobacter sp. JMF_06 NA1]MDA3077950.1 hypothetical protein [Campylobacter sp. JMF_06 NA1]
MILKYPNSNSSPYNYFDILGDNENALSKAFAYLISVNQDCFFEFLKLVGIGKTDYSKYQIEIQKNRDAGITDIEITDNEKIHIIVECKIKGGKVDKQRTQYNSVFDKKCEKKILCLLTEIHDSNYSSENDIEVITLSWRDIVDEFDNSKFSSNELVKNFVQFAERILTMNTKEILIQDLGDEKEIQRYNCSVYRTGELHGAPLYFAPYFTKQNKDGDGIKSLSKILGIITAKPNEIGNFVERFESFFYEKELPNKKELIEKWKKGIAIKNKENENKLYTYYFLEEEFSFKNPLKKDGGIEKGRGKNWIAAAIPKNRCVSFTDFLKHIPELMSEK